MKNQNYSETYANYSYKTEAPKKNNKAKNTAVVIKGKKDLRAGGSK